LPFLETDRASVYTSFPVSLLKAVQGDLQAYATKNSLSSGWAGRRVVFFLTGPFIAASGFDGEKALYRSKNALESLTRP
jgi:hypothetical protein